MSRIGNKPITVPDGVQVKVEDHHVTVTGPKGTLERDIHKNMTVSVEGNVLTVTRVNDEPANKSLHGLTRTLIQNMIEGVEKEFSRELQINGVDVAGSVISGTQTVGNAVNLARTIVITVPQTSTLQLVNNSSDTTTYTNASMFVRSI